MFTNLKRIIHFWEIWWNFGRSFRFQFTRCLFRSFFRFDEKMFMVFTFFLYIGMSYRTYLLEYREHFLTAIAILSQWKCSLRKWFLLGRISHPLRPKIESLIYVFFWGLVRGLLGFRRSLSKLYQRAYV